MRTECVLSIASRNSWLYCDHWVYGFHCCRSRREIRFSLDVKSFLTEIEEGVSVYFWICGSRFPNWRRAKARGAELSFCRRTPAEKPTRPAGKASGLQPPAFASRPGRLLCWSSSHVLWHVFNIWSKPILNRKSRIRIFLLRYCQLREGNECGAYWSNTSVCQIYTLTPSSISVRKLSSSNEQWISLLELQQWKP